MSEPEQVLLLVIAALDKVGIIYFVGGSVASSAYGEPRLTHDIDLVASLQAEDAELFSAALGDDFYADIDLIQQALAGHSSFNILHFPTNIKVDIFLPPPSPWKDEEMTRRRLHPLGITQAVIAYVASPEDMILQKLHWYRLTGERSDRQWRDVLGMMKVQGDALDSIYLRYWATELNLTDLLEAAADDAGFSL